MNRSLYDKIYDSHLVCRVDRHAPLLYVDRHFVHEVTSPQAFRGLVSARRAMRHPRRTFATIDHNVSTRRRSPPYDDAPARRQIEALVDHCRRFEIELYHDRHPFQGIVHVVGPEQGWVLPGSVVVCGDSHTSTHGAFGALSFGVGTSDVEHALATQTVRQRRAKNMKIDISGCADARITAKDIALFVVRRLGVSGGIGYAVEFTGDTVEKFSMEERMTLCNMSIEMGAKTGLIAPDWTTCVYLKNRPYAPPRTRWLRVCEDWKALRSDANARFERSISIDARRIGPQVTWGTDPSQTLSIGDAIPSLETFATTHERRAARKALRYMGLESGTNLIDVPIDGVFIGSCTNSRIEDLREAAAVVENRKVAHGVRALVVPGSMSVRRQAEYEELDRIFLESGFEWRFPGCSMCLAMNHDRLRPTERCVSTSNRNFEHRQGTGGRTHLSSPSMAAAAAVHGHLVDIREL